LILLDIFSSEIFIPENLRNITLMQLASKAVQEYPVEAETEPFPPPSDEV
jgi:hypothetical protein